ncbi:keratin, type I cytoskeletal 17-like [Elgaria multicarinata webbii]|uniref:keratin, type I cytoskeletal 17-like n=1 Tax=Elgaria multicarinata webbii TaxID=159646 RepID=UPI002FCCDB10
MQNLNERLASYLEKVHSLEKKNSHLEKEIRLWYEKSSPVARKDYSAYYKTITELQNQIVAARMNNTQIILEIDNSKLIADDFRMKYETELSLRQAVEGDSVRLQRLIDDLTLIKADLELQVEGLKEELIYLKKNYENESEDLRKKLSGTVNVEVDAAPSVDMAQVMENMRKEYELIAEKYRQEAKERFDKLTEEFNKEVTIITTEIESFQTQTTEQRRTLRSLEIELQSQLNMKANLTSNLADVEARYRVELGQIQAHIASIEEQLWQLRQNMEQQNNSYSILLDIKVKLEAEIATYRRLLEGEETR